MASTTRPRQNYHVESEASVNKQINLQLNASYVYFGMSSYFNRDDVALPGFAKFFRDSSDAERENAMKLMKFQNQRGGRIVLPTIQKPERDNWGSGLEAMQAALAFEKNINQSLLDLHNLGGSHGDSQMTDFLEGHFLTKRVELIKAHADHITNLRRNAPGLGEYMYDKQLQD